MFKTVKIEDAIGLFMAHDVTEIRKGEFKGRAFKKGHKIRPGDIGHFQRIGKRHVYTLDLDEGYLHENDAAMAMAQAFCGPGVSWHGEPKEGKLNMFAERDGLLKVDVDALTEINLLGDIMCASRHTNTLVNEGDIVAGTRAIPLALKTDVVLEAVGIARNHGGIAVVKPLRKARTGIVITGNEVFARLIEDQFELILRKKIDQIGSEIVGVTFLPDDPSIIANEIKKLVSIGADLILTTGGMSVDPDDVTRKGIQMTGAKTDCYGAPILPGAMFLIAYIDDVPILGVPACGLYHQITILDLILPRILAGEKIERIIRQKCHAHDFGTNLVYFFS
ncbi:MAG: molybdopterin-binding protein [Deltaproteobacteria bacterium]|nr:molybdopterin-binding protein [Deltaproteobacteria bacterium]